MGILESAAAMGPKRVGKMVRLVVVALSILVCTIGLRSCLRAPAGAARSPQVSIPAYLRNGISGVCAERRAVQQAGGAAPTSAPPATVPTTSQRAVPGIGHLCPSGG